MEAKFFSVIIGALAGLRAICPRGGDDCPKLRVVLGLILGAVAGVCYILLFLGKRALECCDLIALILVAYLFTFFISNFLPEKKTS